jgi:pre-mRNA-splicing factor 38A
MANRTEVLADTKHGVDPQNLVEKLLRARIYESRYWKEHCFGLDAATLVEKAVAIDYVGSTFGGNHKPTPFVCLVLKLLQIQPDDEAVIEYVRQDEYKYLRALGALYFRLTARPVQVYSELEPLLSDYRKLAVRSVSGWSLTHMDEFIDGLLRDEHVFDIALPTLPKRHVLEQAGSIGPRASALAEVAVEPARSLLPLGTEQGGPAHDSDDDNDGDDDAEEGPVRAAKRERSWEDDGREAPADDARAPSQGGKKLTKLERRLLAKQRAAVEAAAMAEDGPVRRREQQSSEELSVAEWNAARAKLGMAPLREKRS